MGGSPTGISTDGGCSGFDSAGIPGKCNLHFIPYHYSIPNILDHYNRHDIPMPLKPGQRHIFGPVEIKHSGEIPIGDTYTVDVRGYKEQKTASTWTSTPLDTSTRPVPDFVEVNIARVERK